MGKRRAGLSGLSRFALQAFKDDSNSVCNETLGSTPSRELEEPPVKKRKTNAGVAVSNTIDSEKAASSWVEEYDASGLVPHYMHASEVPHHLKKCKSCILSSCPI